MDELKNPRNAILLTIIFLHKIQNFATLFDKQT